MPVNWLNMEALMVYAMRGCSSLRSLVRSNAGLTEARPPTYAPSLAPMHQGSRRTILFSTEINALLTSSIAFFSNGTGWI